MAGRAADAFDEIRKHRARIKNQCYDRHKLGDTKACWCQGAGPNGSKIPCPTVEEDPPPPAVNKPASPFEELSGLAPLLQIFADLEIFREYME